MSGEGEPQTGAGHDHTATLEQQIAHAVASIKEARADGTITLKEALHVAADITHAAWEVLDSITDPVAGKEDLIRAAEAVYDEYLAPLDLVGVPNRIEPYVDKVIRDTIRPGIALLVDAVGG